MSTAAWPPVLDAPGVVLPSGVHKFHAIEFALIDGYRPLQVDLYLPPRPSETTGPAIVFIHGGGWAVGSRRRFGRAFKDWSPTPLELLALEGFAVVCVDYRLSGEARYPAQVHDCKAAVRWTKAHAAELNINPGRVLSWGESAGGQLALMLGLTAGVAELEGTIGDNLDQSSDVCAVVDWYGVTDLLAASAQRITGSTVDQDAPDSYESRMLGAPVQTVPDLAVAASPIHYVHADAPPIQIHHGDADTMVPYRQSEEFVCALTELEVDVEFVTIPGADHFWIGAPSIRAIFEASLAFARQHGIARADTMCT